MPTERFKRLSAGKKTIIRKAAMKEFARVPFEKASINQIIQNAGISRGSFYTYFEDKQDLLNFLMEEINEELKTYCLQSLNDNKGDYLAMMDGMFDHMVGMLDGEREWIEVARNVFNYQENLRALGLGSRFAANFVDNPERNLHGWIAENMNDSLFWEPGEEERYVVIALGGMSLLMALKRYYMCPDEKEEIRRLYRKGLRMIRYGALKDRPT